jgi:hypothetical protein
MPGLIQGSKIICIYLSDDTESYFVDISGPHAVAGGFATSGPASGGIWPYQASYMRTALCAVQGSGTANSAPARAEIPIAQPTNAIWLNTTPNVTVTYPWGTLTYTSTGLRGERRYRLAQD